MAEERWLKLAMGQMLVESGTLYVCLQRKTRQPMPPQPPTDLLGQVQEPCTKYLRVVDVPLEGRLVGDQLRLLLGHDCPVVDPVRQLPEVLTT